MTNAETEGNRMMNNDAPSQSQWVLQKQPVEGVPA